MCLEKVVDVPKDSQIDKIRGKFEEARLSLFMPKKVEAAAQKAVSCEKERTVEEKVSDKKTEEHIQRETTTKDEPKMKKEEHVQEDEKAAAVPAVVTTPAPAAVDEAKSPADKKKDEQPVQQEKHTPEQKPRSSPVSDDRFEEYKKKAMAWKVGIEEVVEGWLDYGLMDGLLETISKNKKTIAIVAAAFSAGFYISRKLRSSG